MSKSVKEKAPAPSLALTLAPSSTTTPNVMNPPTSNNVTSWQLTNERGMMKNQVLTISKIAHPLNSMHSCYTITCTGNQCPSVRKCYLLVCMYAFLCVCMYVTCQSMIRYVCMCVCKFLYKLTYVLAYFFTHTYSICIHKYIHITFFAVIIVMDMYVG